MHSDDEMLPRLVQALETSAREIDHIFARAGGELGEGLNLFEALKQRLTSLSDELAGPELAQAGVALKGLADQLRDLDAGLSGETTALQELAGHSRDASQALERLLGHMRLIIILARSARIEAVAVSSGAGDFSDFTAEIATLAIQAQQAIQACIRDHDQIGTLLNAALSAQREFARRYGHVLTELAERLGQTLAALAIRQQASVKLTGDAAGHSGKIAMAAGGAIIALQSGDSIRQRLEHAIAGLRLAGTLADEPGLAPAEREGVDVVLRRLEAAQLDASAAALAGDAGQIESALALLAGDTAGLIDLVRGLYSGGEGATSASFLQMLEAELAEVSDLLGRCDEARGGVDRVTSALTGVLDTCQETVAALAGTVSSIVLIGMNAGLRAARLSGSGRSLVVIAQELKLAADQVAGDARRLDPTFALMQMASGALKREGPGRVDLHLTMTNSLEAMRQTGQRLTATLERLSLDSAGFCAVVEQARLSFSTAGAISDSIASAATQIADSVATRAAPDPKAAEIVRRIIDDRVWPSYTMAAERTIHQAVMLRCNCEGTTAVRAPAEPAPAADVDEFLF